MAYDPAHYDRYRENNQTSDITVEPLYKGQAPLVERLSSSQRYVSLRRFWGLQLVLCSEVVLFLDGPLSEVPLYNNVVV